LNSEPSAPYGFAGTGFGLVPPFFLCFISFGFMVLSVIARFGAGGFTVPVAGAGAAGIRAAGFLIVSGFACCATIGAARSAIASVTPPSVLRIVHLQMAVVVVMGPSEPVWPRHRLRSPPSYAPNM
jgi:hypothetical protein